LCRVLSPSQEPGRLFGQSSLLSSRSLGGSLGRVLSFSHGSLGGSLGRVLLFFMGAWEALWAELCLPYASPGTLPPRTCLPIHHHVYYPDMPPYYTGVTLCPEASPRLLREESS